MVSLQELVVFHGAQLVTSVEGVETEGYVHDSVQVVSPVQSIEELERGYGVTSVVIEDAVSVSEQVVEIC